MAEIKHEPADAVGAPPPVPSPDVEGLVDALIYAANHSGWCGGLEEYSHAVVAAERRLIAARTALLSRITLSPAPSDQGMIQRARDTAHLEWAVSRWNSEVANRPLQNVHRRALDTTWRQMIRRFGGDPEALVGPPHDALVDDGLSQEKSDRVEALERIIRDTLWMARRYAHGRQSYAVSMYNDAARAAVRLDVPLDWPDGSPFALDGGSDGLGGPEMSGLSAPEFAEAEAGLNAKGITPHPDRFSPAGRTALAREEADRG